MTAYLIYNAILLPWLGVAVFIFILLFFVTAPYGRFSESNWGPMISSTVGWIIQEAVSPIVFGYFFIIGTSIKTPVMWIFFIIWIGHYFNRSFIYPFRQHKAKNRMPITIMLSAVFFNIINGFTNGYYLGSIVSNEYNNYFFESNFILGMFIFIIGLVINLKSDNILINLKKENQGYQIPQGFLYRYISCPNYFGEILEWLGFAIMTWCLPGSIFAIWTMANLIPRAVAHHAWYKSKFKDYPVDRKAIIPFIF